MLDSAIPQHLKCPRARPASTSPGFEPPFPAYCARFPEQTEDLVMAVIGAQYRSKSENDGQAVSRLSKFIQGHTKYNPQFLEWASVTDRKGFYTISLLAYWKGRDGYQTWASKSGFQEWWDALDSKEQGHGWFLEVFFPTVDRFETVFSNNEVPEGAAHLRESVSGPMREHVYWGSMRDRLPAAQIDALVGTINGYSYLSNGHQGRRIRVTGKKNLAVIRSGQDWFDTYPEERDLYLSTMDPVLERGMNFLRDKGKEVGCYSCRFMEITDPETGLSNKDRTLGLAYFDDLSSLERWAKEHPTHLEIFGGFLQYAKKLNNNVTLKLFHEVLVVKPEQQLFEYISCHPETGMLVAV